MNIEDRKNDPEDGIDYDEIIASTEADFRARRGIVFTSQAAIRRWLDEIFDQAEAQREQRATRRMA